jgi:cytochrome P450
MFARWMISLSGDEHTAIRHRVSRAFTKSAVAAYRPRVEATVAGLLEELAPRGQAELVRDLAFVLPTRVICELMALPADVRDGLDDLLVDLNESFLFRNDPEHIRRGDHAAVELQARLRPLVAQRAEHPGDDLISRLATGSSSQPVDFEDLVANSVLLLQAGHETTMNAIASTVYVLLTHPDQRAEILAEPARLEAAIEEVLRLHSPISVAPRVAVEDIETPGCRIPAGHPVPYLLMAANRDAAVYQDPDSFRPDRDGPPHLAFGLGPHHCIGAPLARLNTLIAVAGLFARLPGLALARQPTWLGVIPFRGLRRLDVTW